jgi:hypothetical protein
VSSITRKDLIKIAKQYGKNERSVRWAVDSRLIPRGYPKGRGHAAGQDWFYPAGTDEALKLVYELQADGVRGGALDFTVWWQGYVPISPRAISFIERVVHEPRDLIRKTIARGKEESFEHYAVDSDQVNGQIEPQSSEEIFGEDLGEKILQAEETLKDILPLFDVFLPGVTESLHRRDLENIIIVSSTFVIGYEPSDFFGSPNVLVDMIFRLARARGAIPDGSVEQLKELGERRKFSPLIAALSSSDPDLFNQVRDTVKTNSTLLNLAWETARFEEARQKEMSARKKSRQGPWKQPYIAPLALVVGIGVGSVTYFNSLGLNGEKLMLIV